MGRARGALVVWRGEGTTRLRDRFRRAVTEGALPSGTDSGRLARYLMTVANGTAVQATGGATRDGLRQVAGMALRSRPSA